MRLPRIRLLYHGVDERREKHIGRDVHWIRIAEHLNRAAESLIGIERDAVERDAGMQFVEDEMARESCGHCGAENECSSVTKPVMPCDEERAGRGDRKSWQRMIDAAMMRPALHDAAHDEPESQECRERDTDKETPIVRLLCERVE